MSEVSAVRQIGRWVGRIAAALAGLMAAFSVSSTGLVLLLAGGVIGHQALQRGFGMDIKLSQIFSMLKRVVGVMAREA